MPPPDATQPVAVLGAGIVGICTALSLLEQGVAVTLIDRGAPGQETSMGNAGVVSPWSIIPQSMPGTWKNIPSLLFGYGRPLSVHPRTLPTMIPWGLKFLARGREDRVRATAKAMGHLAAPSVDLYRHHLQGTGAEDLIADSYYVHAFRDASRARLDALDIQLRAEAGAEVERVEGAELARVEPALSPEFKAAMLIKGQARVRSPGRLGQVLADKARAVGATFKRTSIRRLSQTAEGWQIDCDGKAMQAKRVVLCMGAWSTDLLKPLGLSPPLMVERGYHAQFADPGITLNNSVMDVDAKVVASSMEGGVRVAGQAEFAPLDAPASERRSKLLVQIAKNAFPDLNTSAPSFWMGRRPSFPDSLPMLGEAPDLPGLYLNFGHSHYGLLMAPKSGQEIARLVSGTPGNIDLAPYSPSRF